MPFSFLLKNLPSELLMPFFFVGVLFSNESCDELMELSGDGVPSVLPSMEPLLYNIVALTH